MIHKQLCPRRRRFGGFTLSELAVVIALFGLFSTTALASLSLTLRHWKTLSAQTDVYTSCRTALSTMSKELRQGIPNQAPGFKKFFYELPGVPTSDVTAVWTPNVLNQHSNEVVFTEANPNHFTPAMANFVETNPLCYRTVRYYVKDGKELRRQLKTYDSSGGLSDENDSLVTACDSVSLRVTCRSCTIYDVEFSASRIYSSATKEANLKTTIYILGR